MSELITHLQEIDQKNQYVLFLKKENFHECRITNARFTKELADIHWYTAKEQLYFPQIINRTSVDFMHFPHWNVPLLNRVPFMTTIHDLILVEDSASARSSTKNAFVHGFKYAAFRTVLEHAIHRSKHILTVSEYSKSRILKHFGIKQNKITVTLNGIIKPADFKNVSLSQLGVYDPYFLYVGNAYPHKNLRMMIHAFASFAKKFPHVQLVIAGNRDLFSKALEKEAKELNIPTHQIRFLHLPTDQEISALYEHASLFIYPSRIEGFGMPPLEALTHGTPVAAANTASLPEVLQNHALFFEQDDIDTLQLHMTEAINNPKRLKQQALEGKAFAAKYDWRKTAEQTLHAYNHFPLRKRT